MSKKSEKNEPYVSWLESGTQEKVKPEGASSALWAAAVGSFLIYATLNVALAMARGASGSELIGTVIGCALWPLGIVALSLPWNRTQRGRVKVFTIVNTGLIALALTTFFSTRAYQTFMERQCKASGDLTGVCAKINRDAEAIKRTQLPRTQDGN